MRVVLYLFFIFLYASGSDIKKNYYESKQWKEYEKKVEWFYSDINNLSKNIKNADKKELAKMMEKLGFIWLHKSGATGFEVAPFIAKMIIKDPLLVFTWFEKYPKEYKKFIDDSQYKIFTNNAWQSDKEIDHRQKELESLREDLILVCKKFLLSKPKKELYKMAYDLVNHVEKLKIRQID